jgi:hypothetical protein
MAGGTMTMLFGRVLRTGLSSLRDRAAARLAASRFNPSRAWEEVLLIIGLLAIIAYIMDGHGAPDPLSIAVLAALILIGKLKDRMP